MSLTITHAKVSAIADDSAAAAAGEVVPSDWNAGHSFSGALPAANAGVPAAGLAGQVLKKNTNADYDSGWLTLATVATTGAYSDLTGKPTLGTMAAQSASDYLLLAGGTMTGAINGATLTFQTGIVNALLLDASQNVSIPNGNLTVTLGNVSLSNGNLIVAGLSTFKGSRNGFGNPTFGAASAGYVNVYWGPSATILADDTTGANKSFQHSQNAEFVGGAWKYINADKAVQYVLNDGKVLFRVAAAGTAGAALTWTNAVTIDQSGNVNSIGVVRAEGGTAPTNAAGAGVELGASGAGRGFVQAYNRTTAAYAPLDFFGSTFIFNGGGGVGINLASVTYMLDTGGRSRSYTNIVDQLPGGGFFGLDQAAATVTLANNGTYDIPNFSGLFVLTDINVTGQTGLFICGAGQITLIGQTTNLYSTVAGTAAKVNVFYNAGTTSYRIENKQGNSISFGVATLRTRAAP